MPSAKDYDDWFWFNIVMNSIGVLTLVTAISLMVMSYKMKSDYDNNTKRYQNSDKWESFWFAGVTILAFLGLSYGVYYTSKIFEFIYYRWIY